MVEDLLDLKNSTLTLEGDKKTQESWSKRIADFYADLQEDKNERVQVYTKRNDFFRGDHGDYSNVTGLIKDTKNKKGHTNQVTNYAGRTTVKIAFGIANNPPNYIVNEELGSGDVEQIRAQAVEDYLDVVFKDKVNKFWKSTYRNAAFNQAKLADAAIKIYPLVKDKKIKMINHENMGTIMVGWNGNPGEFDFVIAETYLTPKNVFDQYGIKVNEKVLGKIVDDKGSGQGNWNDIGGTWGGSTSKTGKSALPTGKNKLPKVKVVEFDSSDVYAIKIEGELVQLIIKDDITFPKVKFWTIVPNIPNSPSPWSIADIDFLYGPQIEINDNDNRSSDHLRVGNVQRYVAYNMSDFDPASLTTSSGQVIFVNDPDGKSRFEPLQTNINNFPDDQYHNRKMQAMFDMGLPKVNYGNSGADSGRSKAIDYQSSIDLTTFKRDAWELALQDICEKIQIFGHFLHPEQDWFLNEQDEFVVRTVEFDWSDILPVSQADKIVNVANKYNMLNIPLRQAYKELGYRNPDKMIAELKKELEDPNMMILRSKAWQLSQGLLGAQNAASTMAQTNGAETPPPQGGAPTATLNSSQNSDSSKPMSGPGTTTAYSSATGAINQARQQTAAKGG